jgi:hypothetical protein
LGLIHQTDIPLRHPSEKRRPQASEPLLTPPEVIEIDGKVEEEDDPDGDFREEVFDTVMMTVPFTFLFVLLHVYVSPLFLSILLLIPLSSRRRAL